MPSRITTIYPEDALARADGVDVVTSSEAHTLDQLFRERVRRSSDKPAFCQFDRQQDHWREFTWSDIAQQVERWQVAFKNQGLVKGDRVAICYKNSVEWVIFDQAALRLGLVVVPLYTDDRADNSAYVLADSRARLLFVKDVETWNEIRQVDQDTSCISLVLVITNGTATHDERVVTVDDWLPETGGHLERGLAEPADLASIVYTSGTTGRPKGVMLSHKNMLSNAYAGLRSVPIAEGARVLSFLPYSHTLERTVGYYAAVMAGATVFFNREISLLAKDIGNIRPAILISVPRIFERIHNQIYQNLETQSALKRGLFNFAIKLGWQVFNYQQGRGKWQPSFLLHGIVDQWVARKIRDRLGGNLETVIVGGAPLSPTIAKTFISLGVPLLQGYGLTEASPVVSVNTLRQNKPESIGMPLRGVEVKLGANNELLVKGDNIMMGYWGMPDATANTLENGWLKTGDRATIDAEGFIHIIGRIKDILVLANGEKVPPAELEAAILEDPVFEQAMVVGEGKPYLAALVVVNIEVWQAIAEREGLTSSDLASPANNKVLLKKIDQRLADFPGYARIRQIAVFEEEWTIEAGLLTPTLKLKRAKLHQEFSSEIDALFQGHGIKPD